MAHAARYRSHLGDECGACAVSVELRWPIETRQRVTGREAAGQENVATPGLPIPFEPFKYMAPLARSINPSSKLNVLGVVDRPRSKAGLIHFRGESRTAEGMCQGNVQLSPTITSQWQDQKSKGKKPKNRPRRIKLERSTCRAADSRQGTSTSPRR